MSPPREPTPGKPTPRLGDADRAAVDALASPADDILRSRYPGDAAGRQPVHTVYVPADQVRSGLVGQWGAAARAALDQHAPDPERLAAATGLPVDAVAEVWPLIVAKLQTEPIEDLRIDLEDGYGDRDPDEEDTDVVCAVTAMATAAADGTAPPYWGIRFKSFEAPTRARGLRTVDLALGSALAAGPLPEGFVLTLPKVSAVEQVEGMVEACRRLERAHGLPADRLRFELQVETPQAILGADGTATVARMVHAAQGRCSGLHFGTYDYTAALGVGAGYQSLEHRTADHAKAVMMVAAAGTGVWVCDGSTNVLPVGDPHVVHAAWALHARLVRRSLEDGIYQGWDMHPAHLPSRYLATYRYFREGLDGATRRLRAYAGGGGGEGVLDEPATARALADFVRRGVRCGAVAPEEVRARTGVDLAEL